MASTVSMNIVKAMKEKDLIDATAARKEHTEHEGHHEVAAFLVLLYPQEDM
jgi:hypothetical protein